MPNGGASAALLKQHREQQYAATEALREVQEVQEAHGSAQVQQGLALAQLQREGSMFKQDFNEIVRQVVTVQVRAPPLASPRPSLRLLRCTPQPAQSASHPPTDNSLVVLRLVLCPRRPR